MKEPQSSMLEKLTIAFDNILEDKDTRLVCDNDGMAHIGFGSNYRSKSDLLQLLRELYGRNNAKQSVFPDMFTLKVSEVALQNHIDLFKKLFADHVDPKTEMMHVSSVIQGANGVFEISPADFMRNHAIHATVLLNTKEVAKLLIDWTTRNKFEYTKKFHLLGVEVNSPLILNFESYHGITVNPPNEEYFDIMLNKKVQNRMDAGEGAIVAIRETVPVFHKLKQSSDFDDDILFDRDIDFMINVCHCLSFVLNSYVTVNCSWLHDWNVLPFHMKAGLDPISGRKSEHAPSKLNQEDLNKALEILPNFKKLSANKRFRISVSRGLKSMHTLTDYEDKIINMRIAMESLLLKGNESGIREKLAIVSAKFLEADLPGRRKIRNSVEKVYKDSSSIIHGSKNAEDVEIDIKAIQKLWNKLILEILEEGKIPNWNNIVLE